jgi:citrate synthase
LGLRAFRAGLYYVAVAPLLHLFALEADNPAEIEKRLALLADPAVDYSGAIYAVVSGQLLADAAARVVFDAVLVAFHAGLGSHAPTIALPRGSISTRASTAMALAAGYTAAGPAHVGACKVVMAFFDEIVAAASGQTGDGKGEEQEANVLVAHARAALDARLAAGERVAGFGHPLFRQDPRNPHLRDLIKEYGVNSAYLVVYDTIAARMHEVRSLHPNIDAIAAALFLTLGISPAYGTALFLCARMVAMVAHCEQARHEPPFGVQRKAKRK